MAQQSDSCCAIYLNNNKAAFEFKWYICAFNQIYQLKKYEKP